MIHPSTSLIRLLLVFSCIALPFANAQIETIPDPNEAGASIVQVVTTDINGLPVTNIAETLLPGQLTTATTTSPGTLTTATTPNPLLTTTPTATITATTTTPIIQGPVAQPAPTVPAGEGVTSYQYTTVDANGATTVLHDIFTPTYNTPSPPSSPTSGTVLGLSAWSAIIGTHTVGGPTSAGESWWITRMGVGRLLVLACGVVAGALAIF